MNIIEKLTQHSLIAILRGVPSEKAVPVAHALYDGGIRLLEITFDQRTDGTETLDAIRKICEVRDTMPGLIVGAGTVMNPDQVRKAHQAGAAFILAPNTDPAVIGAAKALSMPVIPGAMTPTEITAAYALGADVVKVFPASVLGPDYIKAIHSPLPHIPLLVVGGVDLNNLSSFIKAGAIGTGIGSCLVDRSLIQTDRFDQLTMLARQYVSLTQ